MRVGLSTTMVITTIFMSNIKIESNCSACETEQYSPRTPYVKDHLIQDGIFTVRFWDGDTSQNLPDKDGLESTTEYGIVSLVSLLCGGLLTMTSSTHFILITLREGFPKSN